MKIAHDRIPHPPVQEHSNNTMYAAGESGRAQHRSPYSASASSHSASSHPASVPVTEQSSPQPLATRRQIRPNSAAQPRGMESQTYHNNSVHAAQQYPEYHDYTNYHDNHRANPAPAQMQEPYQRADDPYSRSPNHDRATTGHTMQSKYRAHGQNLANQQGPYQAVVVFLLLLMALAIMGIVYQLFFRPNFSNETLPIADNRSAVDIPRPTGTAEEPVLLSDSSDTAKINSNISPQSAVSPPERVLPNSLANTSPISSVTPSGDRMPSAASPFSHSSAASESSFSSQAPPTATDTVRNSDESSLLLQSKVGGIGYWIQVGAFSSLKNANSIKRQLSQNHLESLIQESQNSTGKLYRVRVGLYTSKEETERILRQVKKFGKFFENSMIIKIEL